MFELTNLTKNRTHSTRVSRDFGIHFIQKLHFHERCEEGFIHNNHFTNLFTCIALQR